MVFITYPARILTEIVFDPGHPLSHPDGEAVSASILVIDDEESLRFTLERFLSFAGHRVVTAGSCDEAREEIAQGAFDLILLDLSLPDGSGMDLLGEVKRGWPKCPVIVMTAYPAVQTARDAFRMGAFDYIPKPVRQRELMESVVLALREKRQHEAMEA